MTDRPDDTLNDTTLERLSVPIGLTLAGLWAERLARSFWPLWSIMLVSLSVLAFGLHDQLPVEVAWVALVVAVLGAGWAAWAGYSAFHRPSRADAISRLDATLPGRPLATLADNQAIGVTDPASAAVWEVHRARMAARAATAKHVSPDLRLARRDPFGLRYVALTAFIMAMIFGSFWRAATVTGLVPGTAEAVVGGPSWEGWVQPPPHTARPALYLNDIDPGSVTVPVGSRVQIRLYGEVGALTVAETVSARAGTDVPPASEPAQEFQINRSGQIEIAGPNGRLWEIVASPDAAPKVAITGPATRESEGRLRLPFSAEDDYGVTGGRAVITLDLAAVDRRYGLAVEPEPRDPLVLDLPMPIRGDRAKFEEALIDDVSKTPYANMPVQVRLEALDATGQIGQSPPMAMVLPAMRFFDPLAAAVIELRRDILWNRVNGTRSVQILRAVTNHPEGFIRNAKAWPRLRAAMRRLDENAANLSPVMRDELADELWEIALLIEEGDLASAAERMQRAQDRLEEAMRNGADPAEIQELMDEYRQAMRDYMNELAQQAERRDEGIDEPGQQNQESMRFNNDQLQQMFDELQRLMEEGRMAEAAELMERMRQLMENMRVEIDPNAPGQPGQGQPGNQAMRDLGETLRDQQGLSDDSFRELQNPGQQGQQGEGEQGEGQQGQEGQGQDGQQGEGQQQGQNGQQPGQQPGPGQPGAGQGDQPGQGPGQGSLQDRQRELRNRLGEMGRGQLPGDGTELGEQGRRHLEDAGRAMEEAEDALRDGDLPSALDRQAEAMESMRQGRQSFGEAMAQEQREQNGQPGEGQQGEGQQFARNGQGDPLGRDPLGRDALSGNNRGETNGGELGEGGNAYGRAEELLGEIRRRQGELTRPESERDYLRRLLDLF